VEKTREFIAMMLGLHESDLGNTLGHDARWVDTGSEQLIIPLASADAVRRAKPNPVMLTGLSSNIGRSMAYVFAENGETRAGKLLSRFFFMKHGAVIEDPGTGSATANLGGFLLHNQHAPCAFNIEQGEAVGRPCHLGLAVDAGGQITVSGNVIEIARGVVQLP
jgi:trans-2,3-dihydro-3-hydroxyanthranilate isomerase